MITALILIAAGLLLGGFFKHPLCKGAGAVCLGIGLILLAWYFRIVFVWIAAAIMIAAVLVVLSPLFLVLLLVCLVTLVVVLFGALILGSPFLFAGLLVILVAGALGTVALKMLKVR